MKLYHPLIFWKSRYTKRKSWYQATVPIDCETKPEARAIAKNMIITEKTLHLDTYKYLKFRAKVLTVIQ
jgi:hypothetical protein